MRTHFLAPVLGAAPRARDPGKQPFFIGILGLATQQTPGGMPCVCRVDWQSPGGNLGICRVERLRNLYASYCSAGGGGRSKICISHCQFQPGNPENTWIKPMPRPGNLECARLKPMLFPGGGARKPLGVLLFRAHPSPPPGKSLGKSQAFA